MPALLSFRDVYQHPYFDGFSCDIEAGASTLIITSREEQGVALLHLITGMVRPAGGTVLVSGRDIAGLDAAGLLELRRQFGIITFNGGLLSNLKLWENITLPLAYHTGGLGPEAETRALAYLERLGYAGNVMALPAHLSLQERRSGALVRALLTQPRLMLYCNSIDKTSSDSRDSFVRVAQEFHDADGDRTSLYLSTYPDLATDLAVDTVIRINESVKTISREQ